MLVVRWFSQNSYRFIKKNKLPPRPKFTHEMELQCEEKFLHGGRGPGGQKINKSNSKVQLKHPETGIVITCQETRSRESNRKLAREKMALEIDRLYNNKTSTREEALQDWIKQGKRSKIKKSKLKHIKHQQDRRLEEAETTKRENELIRSLLG